MFFKYMCSRICDMQIIHCSRQTVVKYRFILSYTRDNVVRIQQALLGSNGRLHSNYLRTYKYIHISLTFCFTYVHLHSYVQLHVFVIYRATVGCRCNIFCVSSRIIEKTRNSVTLCLKKKDEVCHHQEHITVR